MNDNHGSLNLAFNNTVSISTVRVVVDQSECIVLATGIINLEKCDLCVINSWQICADHVACILLCEYRSAAAQEKEWSKETHGCETNERAYKKHNGRDEKERQVRQIRGRNSKGITNLYEREGKDWH